MRSSPATKKSMHMRPLASMATLSLDERQPELRPDTGTLILSAVHTI